MAYPRKLLAEGERIHLELHPHVTALVLPVAALLVVVPVASYTAARVPEGRVQGPCGLSSPWSRWWWSPS